MRFGSTRANGRAAMAWLAVIGASVIATTVDAEAQRRQQPEPPVVEWEWDPNDPRIGLAAGVMDAESAISNLDLLVSMPKPTRARIRNRTSSTRSRQPRSEVICFISTSKAEAEEKTSG